MDDKEYYESVMHRYDTHGTGHSLRAYCNKEGIDYNWVLQYRRNHPKEVEGKSVDMRKGRNGLAGIVREHLKQNPLDFESAYVFYSKDYRKIKILHYDLDGYVIYEKWFDKSKFLKPIFDDTKASCQISREKLILLLTTSIQTKIAI